MPESPDDGRLYNEDDVAEILKRASEKQSSQRIQKSGLTIAELKQIAAEAGIDPRYVSDAVREMSSSVSSVDRTSAALPTVKVDKPNFWGGPLSATREAVIDGVIDDFAWEEIVAEARRTFNDTGEVREWSNSREWASNVNNARSHVTATTRGGKTRFQVFWSNPGWAAATFVPAMVISLISLPIVFEQLALSGLFGAFVLLSIVIMAFASARGATTLIARHLQNKTARLLARVQQIARLRSMPGDEAGRPTSVGDVAHHGAGASRLSTTDNEWGDTTGGRSDHTTRDRTR